MTFEVIFLFCSSSACPVQHDGNKAFIAPSSRAVIIEIFSFQTNFVDIFFLSQFLTQVCKKKTYSAFGFTHEIMEIILFQFIMVFLFIFFFFFVRSLGDHKSGSGSKELEKWDSNQQLYFWQREVATLKMPIENL